MSRKHAGKSSRQRQRDEARQAEMLTEAERVARRTRQEGAAFLSEIAVSERFAHVSPGCVPQARFSQGGDR